MQSTLIQQLLKYNSKYGYPQTQAANATNAKVIKIKKEVEQAQDNLIQAQQSVATLEKKIQKRFIK
jgi:ribosomal protein L9